MEIRIEWKTRMESRLEWKTRIEYTEAQKGHPLPFCKTHALSFFRMGYLRIYVRVYVRLMYAYA